MFTGIIEALGEVKEISARKANLNIRVESPFSGELQIDQSVAHNGVCLTVIDLQEGSHTVTAIAETRAKTNLGELNTGSRINLERCVPANGRLDGHIVQGHVDATAVCKNLENKDGSWLIGFEHPAEFITVAKGSVAVNGVSLTVVDSEPGYFSVAIIPYTFDHTTFQFLKPGDRVNVEFDILGKYVEKLLRTGRYDKA